MSSSTSSTLAAGCGFFTFQSVSSCRATGSHTPDCGSSMTVPRLVERFGTQLAVQNFVFFYIYKIGHCGEGPLPCYDICTIELADAMDELVGRCSRLHDKREHSSFRNLW